MSTTLAIAETLALELELARADVGVSVLFPGAVNTGILGERPAGPEDAREATGGRREAPDRGLPEALERSYRAGLSAGLAPEAVAAAALAAVRERRFGVFTHEAVRDRCRRRVEALVNGEYPATDPGFRERLEAT